MLVQFTRNFNNFKILSKKIKVFRTSDLYDEFVNLGDYINNVLKIELENILNISLITVPNKFLINVGDESIDWVNIIDVIEDNIIPLNKLEKIPPKSVLCSDGTGKIIPITCTENNAVLFTRSNNIHIWRRLYNDDIEDNSLTGANIKNLEQINLDDNITNNFITDDLLETFHLEDGSITSDKISYNTLTVDLLDLSPNQIGKFIPVKYIDTVGVNNLKAFVSGFLTPNKIMDNSIIPNIYPKMFSLRHYSDNPEYLLKYSEDEFSEDYNIENAEIIETYNILPESLEDAHFIPYQNIGNWSNIPWYDNYLEARYFQQGYIKPIGDCKLEGRCIQDGKLRLRHFDDEVRAALILKGVTDDD